MEEHKAQENEEETEDREDNYVQEVYTLRSIKGSSTGKRIDRKNVGLYKLKHYFQSLRFSFDFEIWPQ